MVIETRFMWQPAGPYCPSGLESVSHLHPSAFVAGDDATLIGERAATRGRLAMEDGAERAGEPNSIRHWRFRTRISATLCDPRDRPRAKIR